MRSPAHSGLAGTASSHLPRRSLLPTSVCALAPQPRGQSLRTGRRGRPSVGKSSFPRAQNLQDRMASPPPRDLARGRTLRAGISSRWPLAQTATKVVAQVKQLLSRSGGRGVSAVALGWRWDQAGGTLGLVTPGGACWWSSAPGRSATPHLWSQSLLLSSSTSSYKDTGWHWNPPR